MRLTREEKKRQTRKAILDAAIKLFDQKGFDNTSIEELAKEAQIGKGTVYSYFETKKDILFAFCEGRLELIHDEVQKKQNDSVSFIDRLVIIFMNEFEFIANHKDFGRLFLQQTLFPDETQGKGNNPPERKWLELFYTIIDEAAAKGEIRRDIDRLYLAGHFFALYILVVSSWYSGRIESEEVKPVMHLLFSQVLQGLARHHSNKTKR